MIPAHLFFAFAVGSFFAGSFPTAYVIAKIFFATDIRRRGSGNVGATNAFRVMGKWPGLAVFAIDFLKGWAPVWFFREVFAQASIDAVLWVGSAAILGHVFTPFLAFKGGKGIATGAGVLCASLPLLFLGVIPVFVVTFLWTRMVSLSSLVAAAALVLGALYLRFAAHALNLKSVLVLFLIFCLFVWTHRGNITRIVEEKESRF